MAYVTPTRHMIRVFIKKNYGELRYNGLKLTYRAAIARIDTLAVMVEELHSEAVELGSMAGLNQLYINSAMRCIDIDNETYGWNRTAKQMAYFIKHDCELPK